ncbi:MAG: response regulator [Roseiflexaceae bacterium]|nr:response regulator [Roseiflexaceae bacterium]
MHILVVDDNRDILDLIYRLLVADGYEVTTASNGRDALQQEAATHPDLIILDVNLPFVNGWDICRRIKAKRAVPILLLTVRAEQIDIERSRDAGADGHIAKPFDIADFLAQIERVSIDYYGHTRRLGRIATNHR